MKDASTFKQNLERFNSHLRRLAQERNFETSPDTLARVQSYLKEECVSYGLEVHEELFSFQGQTFSNLIARYPSDPEGPRLILGAHFDSVPGSPGADDNASGLVCLLETVRAYAALRKKNRSPANQAVTPVEFVAFNLEEYGMVGSQAYAKKLKREGTPLVGMLSLEMVGYASQEKDSQKMPFFLKPFYPDVGNFIALVANTQSKPFLEKVKGIFEGVAGLPVESLILPANGWVFPDARLSDHSPFWDEGFPALLVTDTSFYRNPYYHSEKDRLETLNLDFLAKVTEAMIKTALFPWPGLEQGHKE